MSEEGRVQHVFVDPSGGRAAWFARGTWLVTGVLLISLGALVLALVAPPALTRVLVPGLGAQLPGAQAPELDTGDEGSVGPPSVVLAPSTRPAVVQAVPSASPTGGPLASPTAAASPGATARPTAQPTPTPLPTPPTTPSASPSPTNGTRPTSPPGQASTPPGQGRPTSKPTPRGKASPTPSAAP